MTGKPHIQITLLFILTLLSIPMHSLAKEPYTRTTTGAIAEHPEQFLGKQVRIEAEIEEVYSLHTLGLVGEDTLEKEAAVNVIVPYRSSASVLEGDKVTIHGTVRRFEPNKLSQEFGWFDSSWFDRPNMTAHWPFKPMIIADSVRLPSGANLVEQTPENDPGLRPRPEGRVQQPE